MTGVISTGWCEAKVLQTSPFALRGERVDARRVLKSVVLMEYDMAMSALSTPKASAKANVLIRMGDRT